MYSPTLVVREKLLELRELLLEYEQTNLANIRSIWMQKGEKCYSDDYLGQEDLPYYCDDPLYMKMIHRFRNCEWRIAQFYHQIDPDNQRQFLMSRSLLHTNLETLHNALEFFAWISNMKGVTQIANLYNGDEKMVTRWDRKPISFFFELDEGTQAKLLIEYNDVEVKPLQEKKVNYMWLLVRRCEEKQRFLAEESKD